MNKILILKNDRVGDLFHSLDGINTILHENKDSEIEIVLSHISKDLSFLFNINNVKISYLPYHLSIFDKFSLFLKIFNNSFKKIYILSPKNFSFYLPLLFIRTKFYGICMNGVNGYRRPNFLLRKFLFKFLINDRGTLKKRKSIQLLQYELTNEGLNSQQNIDFKLHVPKSDNLKKYLPNNYLLVHFKKRVAAKLGWGINELNSIFNQLKKYDSNIVLIKDIEKDEFNSIFRKKYKTLDFENNLFYNNESSILFFDNIEGENLYNLVKHSKKVIAFHGTITSIALLNNTPVLDWYYCDIKNKKDYHSYKNAFYEFKPKYNGYDFTIPSKNIEKTLKKMRFAIRN